MYRMGRYSTPQSAPPHGEICYIFEHRQHFKLYNFLTVQDRGILPVSRFDTKPAHHRQMDGQTDILGQHSPRYA